MIRLIRGYVKIETISHGLVKIRTFNNTINELSIEEELSSTVVHPHVNGLTAAVISAVVNPNLENSYSMNVEAIKYFDTLLASHTPTRAAHLWVEKFYDQHADYRHRNPLIAAIILTLNTKNSRLELYRSADCEAWILEGGSWRNLFPEDMLTTKGHKAFKDALENEDKTLWDVQEQVLNDLLLWRYSLLGLTEQPLFGVKRLTLEQVEKVVLISKPALLDSVALNDLDAWFAEKDFDSKLSDVILTEITF